MSDPRFRSGQTAAKLSELLPPWAPLAACAELAPNNAPWEPAFLDDVRYQRNPDNYAWPAAVKEAMQVCSTCPVRLPCLTYSFDAERRQARDWWSIEMEDDGRRWGVWGGVPGRIREHYADSPDPVAACDEWFLKRYPVLDNEGSMTA